VTEDTALEVLDQLNGALATRPGVDRGPQRGDLPEKLLVLLIDFRVTGFEPGMPGWHDALGGARDWGTTGNRTALGHLK
jgi:hypothetical protein